MDFRPFLLAGGNGTRFWPRSRRKHPKQVLVLEGENTMVQRTLQRLLPMSAAAKCWVITNETLRPTMAEQLPELAPQHVLAEPVARNTAPAAGLAAFLIEREAPDAVIGLFPADHAIGKVAVFQQVLRSGCELAAEGENLVVLGIHPTRPETGYGYIETGSPFKPGVLHVRRFTEKPSFEKAEEFLAAGNYYWNGGIFLAKARTLANAFREHLPETAPCLEKIAAAFGTDAFAATFAEQYPKCENISIDYAIVEPRSAKGEHHSNLYCIPAEFEWNDLGSWAALYDHKLTRGENVHGETNVIEAASHSVQDSYGNYVHAPGKHVALVCVENIVVVDTGDVLMVTTREGCQNVGKLVKLLEQENKDGLY